MIYNKAQSFNYKIPTILIIEDDLTLITFWQNLIQKVDPKANVIWAETDFDAEFKMLSIYENGGELDLIITDINLNGLKNGVDLWSQYFSVVKNKMVLTSSIDYEKFLNLFNDKEVKPIYITKPLNPLECSDVVYKMLHKVD